LDNIGRAAEKASPGVEGFTSALIDAAESGSIETLDRQFEELGIQVNGLSGMAEGPLDSFRAAYERVTDPTLIQRGEDLTDGLLEMLGGPETSRSRAADELAALDAA